MKEYTIDTSVKYEDLVGYISDDNLPNNNLAELVDMEESYRPKVKNKEVDSEFPEPWQEIHISFDTDLDYKKFMMKIGVAPSPKLKGFVYNPRNEENNILDFFGAD